MPIDNFFSSHLTHQVTKQCLFTQNQSQVFTKEAHADSFGYFIQGKWNSYATITQFIQVMGSSIPVF